MTALIDSMQEGNGTHKQMALWQTLFKHNSFKKSEGLFDWPLISIMQEQQTADGILGKLS